jgi:hypothetical protein
MDVTLNLANDVLRLARLDWTVARIAAQLGRPESDITDTLRMLGARLPGVHEAPPAPMSDAAHADMLERMPKRMQDRINKARSEKNDNRRGD